MGEAAALSALAEAGDRPAFERSLNEIAGALGAHAQPLADLRDVLIRHT